MKSSILTKYFNNDFFLMEVELASEIDILLDTLLMLLRLNHNLTPDFVSHGEKNITLYARKPVGDADFCVRFDSVTGKENTIQIMILSCDIDLTQISSLSLNYDLDMYTATLNYDTKEFLDFMKELVKHI